ncbi:MAG: T9SS type A sorting domain-containing protein [Saprospiraceae bacterium]
MTLVDPAVYYGLAIPPSTINFVFNDGAQGDPMMANFPWYAEGKDQGVGNCLDFFVNVADLATCASGTQDLDAELQASAAPNPFNTSTVLSFDNPNGDTYSLQLVNLTGQTVRRYTDIHTGSVEIRRDELAKGLYFAVLTDAVGRFLTEKLVIE